MVFPPMPAAGDLWALFLDVDGTLVEIAATPQGVTVDPSLPALLERLQGLCQGAVALVSGRPIASLDALFRPLLLPAAGVHGWERRRADGTIVHPAPAPASLDALRPQLAAFAEARPGLLFEDKGASLALHYRLAPHYRAAVVAQAEAWSQAAAGTLRLIAGDMVVEFQGRGTDKGTALTEFLAEPPFRGRRPVFAGDDTSDEDGFAALDRFGGITIRVGSHGAGAASRARFHLPDVDAARHWLEAVAAALETASAQAGDGTAAAERPPALMR